MTASKSFVIAGRCQLLPFVALLLLALPFVFTLRNCVAELPERIHQFTAEEVQTAFPYTAMPCIAYSPS